MANLLSEVQAAKILGLTIHALRKWRNQEKGPVYHRIGGAVRYSESDIEEFVKASRVDPKASA